MFVNIFILNKGYLSIGSNKPPKPVQSMAKKENFDPQRPWVRLDPPKEPVWEAHGLQTTANAQTEYNVTVSKYHQSVND